MATINQTIGKIDSIISEIESGKPFKIAALSALSEMTVRIFEEGKNSSGGKIGSYDTSKELWVSNEQLPRAGTNKGKAGKATKTSYYKNYKALREQQGREGGFVNIRLTNELQSDWANVPVGKDENGVRPPNPIPITNNRYQMQLRKDINIKKKEGLEGKYGNIFDLTKAEEKILNDVYTFELNKLFNG